MKTRFQFRLRTLFIMVTVAAVLCAVIRHAPAAVILWFVATIGSAIIAVVFGIAVGAVLDGDRRWWMLPAIFWPR